MAGDGFLQSLWKKPIMDSVCASSEWNVPGKYGPRGELFFFLIHQELVTMPGSDTFSPFFAADIGTTPFSEAGDTARDRRGGYAEAPNCHLDGDSDDDQEDRISESESNCSEQLDGQEQEALSSLRDARKKTSTCYEVEEILPKRWRPCREHRKIRR